MAFTKITRRATGEVIEFRAIERERPETLPSAVAREFGPEFIVGITEHVPVEHGGTPVKIEVGMTVGVVHIGVRKYGEVVKVGRTRVHVKIATYGGKATKVIVRPITEVTT